MPNHNVDIAAAVTAALLGLIGRLMSMAQERRSPFSASLVWELPAAVGLGIIGMAIGENYGLRGLGLWAPPIVVSYMGPKLISWGLARLLKAPELEK